MEAGCGTKSEVHDEWTVAHESSLFDHEEQKYTVDKKKIGQNFQYLRLEQFYIIERVNFWFWILRSICRPSADFQTQHAAKKVKKAKKKIKFVFFKHKIEDVGVNLML